jgi:BlaI family penicillinase repressor
MRPGVVLIGELEWIVMKACFAKGKTSAKIIHEEVIKSRKLAYQTVKTTLDRLAQKGYLGREKFGPIWLYTPEVSEADLQSRAMECFAQTVFGNSIAPVFLHLIKQGKYSHEIEELKKIVNEMEEEE